MNLTSLAHRPALAWIYALYFMLIMAVFSTSTVLLMIVLAITLYRKGCDGCDIELYASHLSYIASTLMIYLCLMIVSWVTMPMMGLGYTIAIIAMVFVLYRIGRGGLRLSKSKQA